MTKALGASAPMTRQQALRMRRFSLAVGTYFLCWGSSYLVAQIGLGEPPPGFWQWFAASAVAINLVFACLFISGLNLRFPDASLTREQIIVSALWGLFAVHTFPAARPLILMFFIPAFCFGMLKLNARQYLLTALIILGEYLALLIYESRTRTGFDLNYEIFVFCLFSVLLLWLAWFGGVVNQIRRELKQRTLMLEEANRRITAQNQTDELTQVYNRRHAIKVLHHLIGIADRFDLPFSLALIDIDHFKQVNDTHGHQVGDEVLRQFSQRMCKAMRASDIALPTIWCATEDEGIPADDPKIVARYGGEEFLLFFPGAGQDEARQALERIAREVTTEAIKVPFPLHVTFSAGVAQCRKGEPVDALLSRTDQAMYAAKAGGRNRIECAAAETL